MNSILVTGTALRLVSAAVFACVLHVNSAWSQPVLTWHNDTSRTGQNQAETILTPANVNVTQFGKLFSYPVDGQMYAQPLFVPAVSIPGKGVHNVVYVATENDSVYAFDADSAALNPSPLWHTSFVAPPNVLPIQTLNCKGGEIVPLAGQEPSGPVIVLPTCTIYPISGITGTPVISTATNTLYVVASTQEIVAGVLGFYVRLHALDITSGAEKAGSPALICGAPSPVTGGCTFGHGLLNSEVTHQRTGLLLMPQAGTADGVLYMGFVDVGMVLAYDAATLAPLANWTVVPHPPTPTALTAGVWGSGGGVSGDSAGYIYVSTGDGLFDADIGGFNYGDSLVKLHLVPGATAGTFQLKVADYFTPSDQACRGTNDVDLGSGGPLVLPTQPGPTPDLVVIAGKGSALCDAASPIELVNRHKMGHLGGQLQTVAGSTGGYWSSPAYWKSSTGAYLYASGFMGAHGDFLRQYALFKGQISPATSVAQTPTQFLVGATPSVSANGTSNGIVWALRRQEYLGFHPATTPVILHAYDASNVGTELYNSSMNAARDQAGLSNKFAVPTIANGKVFVGTMTELDVYGLLPAPATKK